MSTLQLLRNVECARYMAGYVEELPRTVLETAPPSAEALRRAGVVNETRDEAPLVSVFESYETRFGERVRVIEDVQTHEGISTTVTEKADTGFADLAVQGADPFEIGEEGRAVLAEQSAAWNANVAAANAAANWTPEYIPPPPPFVSETAPPPPPPPSGGGGGGGGSPPVWVENNPPAPPSAPPPPETLHEGDTRTVLIDLGNGFVTEQTQIWNGYEWQAWGSGGPSGG